MPFHLVAFDVSQSSATLAKLNAVQSGWDNIQNNNVVIPANLTKIIGAFCYGATLTRAQLQAPSLLLPGYPDIAPYRKTLPAAGSRLNWGRYLDNPLELKPTEQLSMFISNGGAEHDYGAVILADAVPTPKRGRIFTLKATGTTTLTADALTQCPLTFEDNLPVGKYSCVGVRCKTATGIYFRIGTYGSPWRPGGLCVNDLSYEDPEHQRGGDWGEWFQFDNTVNPVLEVIATAADTAQTVYLDLIGPA